MEQPPLPLQSFLLAQALLAVLQPPLPLQSFLPEQHALAEPEADVPTVSVAPGAVLVPVAVPVAAVAPAEVDLAVGLGSAEAEAVLAPLFSQAARVNADAAMAQRACSFVIKRWSPSGPGASTGALHALRK